MSVTQVLKELDPCAVGQWEWVEPERSLLRLNGNCYRLDYQSQWRISTCHLWTHHQPASSCSALAGLCLLESPDGSSAVGHKAGNYQSAVARFFPPTLWVPRYDSDLSKLSLGGYPGCFPHFTLSIHSALAGNLTRLPEF